MSSARSVMQRTFMNRSLAIAAENALSKAKNQHKGSFGMTLVEEARVRPVDLEHRRLGFHFRVPASMKQARGEPHAGAYAALADVLTTTHLWAMDPKLKHVSVDFNMKCSPTPNVDDDLVCITEVAKVGKRLAFTSFRFVDSKSRLLAEGTHTKAVLD